MAIVTMTQALKKLYKAVVGEDTNKNNPTKIVSELADNYSGSLPEVTSADNGDVLTVVDGEWAKAEGGGGASGMVVETEWITNVGPYQDADGLITTTSASDIFEAFDNGSNVVIHFIKPESGGSSISEEYVLVASRPVNPSGDYVLAVMTSNGAGYPSWCNKISVENGKILFMYYSE